MPDTNKTLEERFDEEFYIEDETWGKARYGEHTIFAPSKVLAFIKKELALQETINRKRV